MNAMTFRTCLTGSLALALGPCLLAQDDFGASKEFLPRLQVWTDVAVGKLEHDTSGSNLDGNDSAVLLELGVEGFGESGFGGGVRLGFLGSDEGLFDDAGVDDVMAASVDLYLHISQRWSQDRFSMPLRFGLLVNSYGLEQETSTGTETIQFDTIGFRTELEPEFLLSDWDGTVLTAGSRLSLGSGWTNCSTDPSTVEADSSMLFYGIDLGLRLRAGMGSFHLGWAWRGQTMDDSDVEGGVFYRGFDADFSGFVIGGGLVF